MLYDNNWNVLATEVTEWAASSQIFNRKGGRELPIGNFGNDTIVCCICEPSEYHSATAVDAEEDSFYLQLEQIIAEVDTAYYMLDSYQEDELSDAVAERIAFIANAIDKSVAIDRFAKETLKSDCASHLRTMICRHLASVVHARVLTFSKRFGPTEMLFDAYRAGVVPFGWNWEEMSLMCLSGPREA